MSPQYPHLSSLDYPAPWVLHGEGIMLFYRFSKAFVRQQAWIPETLAREFRGGLGSVMLVNYTQSPVGPYRELLIIPGVFGTAYGKRRYIPRIFVDSEASVVGGQDNWGIPKEFADISWQVDGNTTQVRVSQNGTQLLEIAISQGGLSFPVSTQLVPMHLYQERAEHAFLTSPKGKGTGKFARIRSLEINPQGFPDFRQGQLLGGVHVRDFTMNFPEAEIHSLVRAAR